MWSGIISEESLIPESTRPAQFYDIWCRTRAISPERALVLVVLWQAAADLQKYRYAQRRDRQRRYVAAYQWVVSDDRRWPFSFVNLCESLGLAPDALRAELLGPCRGSSLRERSLAA